MKKLQEQKQLKIIHKENLQKLSKIKKKERYTLIDLQNLQKVIQNENFQKNYLECFLAKKLSRQTICKKLFAIAISKKILIKKINAELALFT